MTTCINCGQPTANKGFFAICDDCNDASNKLTAMLKSGLTLGFSDGTTETLHLDEDPTAGFLGMGEYTYEEFSRDCDRW